MHVLMQHYYAGKRRWSQRVGLALLVVFVYLFIPTWMFYSRWNSPLLNMSRVQMSSYKPQHESYGIDDPRDPRFYNVLLEEDALVFRPCQDINTSASIDHSNVTLIGRLSGTYYIGEEVQAAIILYNGFGKRKYAGGDQLRATIENKLLGASAPCVVTDNRNGKHTIKCEALWSGTSTIIATLAYTRETITSIYRIRTTILATRNIYGMFKSRSYKEETICHPNYTHLLMLTNYTLLCNMTYMNSGMPFYCGKPKDVHLLCQDWQQVRTSEPYPELPVSECEQTLLKRGHRTLKQKVNINVKSHHGNRLIAKPNLQCSEYNVSILWHSRQPTGFFYNKTWILRHCRGPSKRSYISCLKGRRVYLFGDSTLRAWYSTIIKRFKCQPVTEKWEREKWHKETECCNKKSNFSVGWYPHSQPFYVGNIWDDVNYTLYSVARRIDNIPQNIRAIVVVQLYMHMLAFHHNVFKQRMEIIRTSIENFLTQSRYSIVMIKAPHTFESTPAGSIRLSDYYGYVYSKILYEVFDGLHDRVVLLNNRDITQAQHVKSNHPSNGIVNVMVDQMLSYACK